MPDRDHQESAEITSPPALVEIARQVTRLMVSLTNRTEPSQRVILTPPGWELVALLRMRPGGNMQDRVLGSPAWL